jgi:hypothetical protein
MGIDAAEVGTAREKRLQRDYSFKTLSPTGTSFGVIMAGVNVPGRQGSKDAHSTRHRKDWFTAGWG